MGRRKKETGETYEERTQRLEKNFEIASKSIHRREITFDTNNYVVMANNMILHSASNLTLNELKLLRFFIMQTEKDDKELFEYTATIPQLSKSLEISPKVLYREIDSMTTHLMREVIIIGKKKDDKWKKFHWVDICNYEYGKLTVKISEELKPFLVGLRSNFTRYRLSDIVGFNSIYALRIYEVLNGYMNENNLPHADVAIEISISVDELRRVTDTIEKFERYSSFKSRVIDTATREINEKSNYYITATPYKNGRNIAGFDFLIESQTGYYHRINNTNTKKKTESDSADRQMNLMDYQSGNTFKIT